MQAWDNIIQAAMLGTDKKLLAADDLPEEFVEVTGTVTTNTSLDREEKFLQLASIVFNYRQCGSVPFYQEGIVMPQAVEEEYECCTKSAANVLNEIIIEDSAGLLGIWLQLCESHRQLVIPALIPVILNKAEKNNSLQKLAQVCCGKRGEWLAEFNSHWAFSSGISAEELWQTGKPEQRKQVLQDLRISDPVTAREWLQQTWSQENANSKAALIKVLSVNAGNDDIEWLETVVTEKAQKVKDEVLNILKKIPASSVVQKYWAILKESVILKKEKVLFGLSNKTSLQIQLAGVIDQEIFKTGVEKLSNQKEFSDDEFIIFQLMQSVPPALWESHFNVGPETIIGYFQQDEIKKKFLPALVTATVRFDNRQWAIAFMQHSKIFYIDIIPLLPLQQQEYYSNKFFQGYENSIINYAVERKEQWGLELTKHIFQYTANNPYQYNRSFYNRHIHLIPAQIAGELEKCTPTETYNRSIWINTSEYIIKLVTLKIQAIKAFQ